MSGKRLWSWLAVAWVVPPVVAGALGWTGVWGAGSAFGDYLIPVPVAGGVLHLASYLAVTVFLVLQAQTGGGPLARPLLAGASLVAGVMLIDTEELYLSLTTDLPFDVDTQKNPVGLFLLTDTLLAQLWLPRPLARPPRPAHWLFALALPLVFAATTIAGNERLDRPFSPGRPRDGEQRGDGMRWVHIRVDPSAPGFREQAEAFAHEYRPEANANVADMAVYFTASRQAAERGREEQIAATLCLYEDGTPASWHEGLADCFGAHVSLDERLQAAWDAIPLGRYPRKVRGWLAAAEACRGVPLSDARDPSLLTSERCRGLEEQRQALLAAHPDHALAREALEAAAP